MQYNYIPLGVYTLEIVLSNSKTVIHKFNVYGRGDRNNLTGKIYGSISTTPYILGCPVGPTATLNSTTSILTVSFNANDSIITDGYILYYNAIDDEVGRSAYLSTIQSIATTGANTYNLDVKGITGLCKIKIFFVSDTRGGIDGTFYRSRSPITNVTVN